MSRRRYFVGAVASEPPTARPIFSMVCSHPDRGSSLHRRMDVAPAGVGVPAPPKRSRWRAGQKRIRVRPASRVTPATSTKERMATVRVLMAVSHLDLGDPPDREEADRLQNEAGGDQDGADRVAEHHVEVPGVQELKHEAEDDGAQPHADGGPLVLR